MAASAAIAKAQRRPQPRRVSRDAGSYRRNYKGWDTYYTLGHEGQAQERGLSMSRAEYLMANDAGGKAACEALALGAAGCGLQPAPRIDAQRLGIDEEAARRVEQDQLAAWEEWKRCAHVDGVTSFDELQFLALIGTVGLGEAVFLPVRMPTNSRRAFAHAIQDLHPVRISTPCDRVVDPDIVDGVELDPYGAPAAYWVCQPPREMGWTGSHPSTFYTRTPAWRGPYANIYHVFLRREPEQVRGVSELAAAAKLFKTRDDSIDYELMAQIMGAAFPVAIKLRDPRSYQMGPGMMPGNMRLGGQPAGAAVADDDTPDRTRLQRVSPAQVVSLQQGEEIEVLQSQRPGSNYEPFINLVQQLQSASVGLPREQIYKDFTNMSFSAAKAARDEGWRKVLLYRSLEARRLCQPNWEMVQLEALALGRWSVPKGARFGFAERQDLWTCCDWLGPKLSSLNPLQEAEARIRSIAAGLTTLAKELTEDGINPDLHLSQWFRERRLLAANAPDVKEVA